MGWFEYFCNCWSPGIFIHNCQNQFFFSAPVFSPQYFVFCFPCVHHSLVILSGSPSLVFNFLVTHLHYCLHPPLLICTFLPLVIGFHLCLIIPFLDCFIAQVFPTVSLFILHCLCFMYPSVSVVCGQFLTCSTHFFFGVNFVVGTFRNRSE